MAMLDYQRVNVPVPWGIWGLEGDMGGQLNHAAPGAWGTGPYVHPDICQDDDGQQMRTGGMRRLKRAL